MIAAAGSPRTFSIALTALYLAVHEAPSNEKLAPHPRDLGITSGDFSLTFSPLHFSNFNVIGATFAHENFFDACIKKLTFEINF